VDFHPFPGMNSRLPGLLLHPMAMETSIKATSNEHTFLMAGTINWLYLIGKHLDNE